jgi:hypothetical protein
MDEVNQYDLKSYMYHVILLALEDVNHEFMCTFVFRSASKTKWFSLTFSETIAVSNVFLYSFKYFDIGFIRK